jgi:hypothetical protein
MFTKHTPHQPYATNLLSRTKQTELRAALRAKDDAYVRLLRRQAAEVDALLAAMAKQVSEATAAQAEELEAAEAALDEGRRELVAEVEREAAAELAACAAAEAAFTEWCVCVCLCLVCLAAAARSKPTLSATRTHQPDQ